MLIFSCRRCGRRPTFIIFLFPCVGLRPRQDLVFQNQASDVAEGQHLFSFFFLASAFGHAKTWFSKTRRPLWPKADIYFLPFSLRRPSATPRPGFPKPGVRCGRRPTIFKTFSARPSATPDRVVRNQATDVAEGPHFFLLFFFGSAFGHATQGFSKAGDRCGRRPTCSSFFVFGLRPRHTWIFKTRTDVAEGQHFFLFVSSAFGHARPGFTKPGPMWLKANIFSFFFLASTFGHARPGLPKSGDRCGRRPTICSIFSSVGLRPRKTGFSKIRRPMWPKANMVFSSCVGLRPRQAGCFKIRRPMWPKAHFFYSSCVGLRPRPT